eukprot:gene30582-36955_t
MFLGIRNRVGRFSGRWGFASRSNSQQLPNATDWSKYRNIINGTFEQIVGDQDYLSQLKSIYIDAFSWKTFLNDYRRKLIKHPSSVLSLPECVQLQSIMEKVDESQLILNNDFTIDNNQLALRTFLFKRAYDTALHDLKHVMITNKTVCGTSDLTMPHQWYPYARLMKRKIIYHGGPTNSGKTYHAIQRLKAADPAEGGGLYCGPLRLL